MNVLIWLKRDLRLHDHPALTYAAALGPVLPTYIVEPELWAERDAAARHWGFIAESLEVLRADCAALGLTLALRTGSRALSAMRRPATFGPTGVTGAWRLGRGMRASIGSSCRNRA